jgi:hypothetical protein
MNYMFGPTSRLSRVNAVAKPLKALFSFQPHVDFAPIHQLNRHKINFNATNNIATIRKMRMDERVETELYRRILELKQRSTKINTSTVEELFRKMTGNSEISQSCLKEFLRKYNIELDRDTATLK